MTTITLQNTELTDGDNDAVALLAACVMRAAQHKHTTQIDVFCNTRSPAGKSDAGWLEFGIAYKYDDGGKLYVGAIQRQPGKPFEFHS